MPTLKHWIVVADSARARLLQQDKRRGPLTERQDLVHPASKQHHRDLTDDKQGRTAGASRQGGRNALHDERSLKDNEIDAFAREIAHLLHAVRARGDMQQLSLVAPPHFLGLISEHLDAATLKLVHVRIHKNLVRDELPLIAAQIEEALLPP